MSKKPNPPKVFPSYFEEARDYAKVAKTEFVFFDGLLKAKDKIPSSPSLQKALREVAGFLQDYKGRSLDILIDFSVNDPRSGETYKMTLGTLLKPPQPNSHAQVTHFLCLADADSLIAKVHADFDFSPNANEKKPSPHLQLGGRVFDSLLKNHANKAPKVWWNEKLDKPRIPSLPICTALFWHWAFLEYRSSDEVSKLLKTWHWRQLVKAAENAVFLPFFEDGVRMLKNHPENGLLDALYVPLSK